MEDLIVAIDQGTSSTKVLVFNARAEVLQSATAELATDYSANGFVEQDPFAILQSVKEALGAALKGIEVQHIRSLGISNQRETFVLWDKDGQPLSPAIVWACQRSVNLCDRLKDQNTWIQEKTGLLINPYFSGTKVLWMLENHPHVREALEAGELFFGTVDTWLLYHLTDGKSYATDLTNASRTLFFNLQTLSWDEEILAAWSLSKLRLPEIKRSSTDFGQTTLFGLLAEPITVGAMIGDSHASMFGEACFAEGDLKMTLGTGCSLLMSLGSQPKTSQNGLLTTVGWSTQSELVYAWEGAIVSCGSILEWLKHSMGFLKDVRDSAAMAESVATEAGPYLIPAFSGLGAPFWQMDRKASWVGMGFGTQPAHLVKASLESIAFQIKAVMEAMETDLGKGIQQVAMHGGLSKNTYVQRCLAELISSQIEVQDNPHISAQGAAFLAGLQAGIYPDLHSIKSLIHKTSIAKGQGDSHISASYQAWKNLIQLNPNER